MQFELVKGSGTSKVSGLNAFDAALLAAGVGDLNLVKLSSILPVGYKEGAFLKGLSKGMKLPIAYAEFMANPTVGWIGAGIAVGIPYDGSKSGLIMEHSVGLAGVYNDLEDKIEEKLRAMIKEGMELRNTYDYSVQIATAIAETNTKEYTAVFAGVALTPNQDWRY